MNVNTKRIRQIVDRGLGPTLQNAAFAGTARIVQGSTGKPALGLIEYGSRTPSVVQFGVPTPAAWLHTLNCVRLHAEIRRG